MKYRQFGSTDLRVSEVGFGCGRLGGTVERQDRKEAERTLNLAFDRGINYFDTADIYAQGRSEELLGKTFHRRRSSVILASKAGYRLSKAGSFAARMKPLVRPLISLAPALRKSAQQFRGSQMSQEFSADYLRQAIEASLKRLRTDYLDLFQLHSPPPSVLQTGEYLEALEKLKSEGKIRYYGVACVETSHAELCLAQPSISAIQIQINLLNYESASKLLDRARATRVAIVARQPLASGFLAKPLAELEPSQFPIPRVEYDEIHARVAEYQSLVSPQRTIAQAAIQFVLQAPAVSLVLPGMSSRRHLEENLRALQAPALSEDELQQVTRSFAGSTRG